MMFPLLVSAVGNLGALAMQAIAEGFVAMLGGFLLGGTIAFAAVAALKWSLPQMLARGRPATIPQLTAPTPTLPSASPAKAVASS